MGDSRGRFNECLAVLRLAMTQEWFTFRGEHFDIPETTIRPSFRNPEQLLEGLRVAWSSPETLPFAANNGLGMLMVNQKSWADYRGDVAAFNEIRASHGWAPKQPTVVVRVACHETEDEAWDLMARHTVENQESSRIHYQLDDAEHFRNAKGYEQYARLGEIASVTREQLIEATARPQAWGTPDQVFEKLQFIQRMTSAEEFVLAFRFGAMPVELAEKSMRLFAREVLPRVHAMPNPINVGLADVEAAS